MKTNDEIAEHALFVSNLDTTFIDRNRQVLLKMLDTAVSDARAIGYAEAIEAAAKLLSDKGCGSSFCLHPGAIRALAPADKEKP